MIPQTGVIYTGMLSQYAVHWEAIAAELGLEHYHIAKISKDYHNRTEDGCAAMLRRWLNHGASPTWGTLDDAQDTKLHTFETFLNRGVSCCLSNYLPSS